ASEAFGERLLGNLERFHNVTYRPERLQWRHLGILARLAGRYWRQGPAARSFFWKTLWRTVRHSPRSLPQMVVLLGMYQHFRQIHPTTLSWGPYRSPAAVERTPAAVGS